MAAQTRKFLKIGLAVGLVLCFVLMLTGNFGPVTFLAASFMLLALVFATGDRA